VSKPLQYISKARQQMKEAILSPSANFHQAMVALTRKWLAFQLLFHSLDAVLLHAAANAVENATPESSGFSVGAAGLAVGPNNEQRIVTGWNKEAESDDSIHAEENMVGNLIKGEKLARIIILGENETILAPCGGCRDFLTSYSAEEAEVLLQLSKNESSWFPLKDLLPKVFDYEGTIESLSAQDQRLLVLFSNALRIMKDKPYNPYNNRMQATVVYTKSGLRFAATGREDASYHGDSSVEVALGMADAARDREIETVLFMFKPQDRNEPLFPAGRDLQKIIEAAQICEKDIEIISVTPSGQLWATTISKLLPHAFGPKDLEIDVARYL